jgi:sugar lactone lactonase YvrE
MITRSNDGRADPWGGFWIGTMGKKAEFQSGKIYRFFKGRIFELYSNMTITNSICFSPNKEYAFYTDTATQKIMRVRLDGDGWPLKDNEIFIDLTKENLNPDGSVIDSSGCLWNAQWGASRVAKYSPEGKFLESINFPALQVTCPAFGGEHLKTLFVTSASIDLSNSNQSDGATFAIDLKVSGQKEHQIIL